jgi:hypothetical protein
MADPGFCQKLVIEQAMAAGFSLFHEWRTRGDNFKNELDLVGGGAGRVAVRLAGVVGWGGAWGSGGVLQAVGGGVDLLHRALASATAHQL